MLLAKEPRLSFIIHDARRVQYRNSDQTEPIALHSTPFVPNTNFSTHRPTYDFDEQESHFLSLFHQNTFLVTIRIGK